MKKKILLTIFLFLVLLTILSSRVLAFFKPLLPHLNYLLGSNQPATHLFLLGNDTEARANGGFAGSYAKIVIARREATKQPPQLEFSIPRFLDSFREMTFSISFHDIYVPNGQLSGYVKPPDAIQQAFGHGTWQLANADYEPDFPTTANTIRWFLEKGNEVNPDVLGIINLTTIKSILNIVGDIKIDETTTITPDNLYLYLQGKAELNFFPGSTQKADALHSVGNAVLKKTLTLNISKKIKIAQILVAELKNKNIVLNSTNQQFQALLAEKKWAGEYQTSLVTDFYGLVELNLGANKANQYVTHQTTHTITTDSPLSKGEAAQPRGINHQVNIQFQNTSPEANPNPPLHYGGNYVSFLRVYLPSNANGIEINHSEIATDSADFSADILKNQSPVIATDNQKFTILSFWHITRAGDHSEINLSYSLPNTDPINYTLQVLKQNGFVSSPQTLKLFDQDFKTNLNSTETFQIK